MCSKPPAENHGPLFTNFQITILLIKNLFLKIITYKAYGHDRNKICYKNLPTRNIISYVLKKLWSKQKNLFF